VLESSLKEAMASISGVDSNELKVAELSNIMEHNERNLVTAPNLEDWQCYLERYDDIIDATETGAYQHWIKYGDEEGRLWGCFDGYFDSTENLQDFVFTTDVAKQYNSISMKPNLRLFISESIAARGGFLYLKTFEKATETKRKRKIDMPLYYTIVSGNDEDIFKIDHATGQIAIKSAQKLNRGLKSKYQLSISSSDLGGLSSVTTVEITVLESNDPPTAFDATFNIPENLPGVIIGSVFANDTDITMGRQQSLSYKIIGGDPLGFFSINPISGAVSTTVGSKIDFESVKYYELIVQVSDDGPGKLSDTASISVVISDVNENPVFPKAVRYVVENTPVDYIGNGAFLNGKGVENERGSYDGISLAGDIIRCGNGVSTCGTRNIRKIESIVAEEYIKNDYRGYILEFSSPDYNNVHKQGPREAEYRIHPRANSNLQQSGTFEACLYAKVSKDFDGIQQLISVRYYNTNNALIGTANGGFPNKRGIWEHVCVGFDSQSIRVSNFIYSAGYPLKNTRGNVKIFGISLNLGKTIGGPLSGFDIDAGDSLTYNLLSKNTPFEIRNGNKLAVTKALNYERQHLYILNIEAVDKNGLKGYGEVEINVVDANDAPVTRFTKRYLSENSKNNVGIGPPLLVEDEDKGDSFQFKIISGNQVSKTGLDSSNRIVEWLVLGTWDNSLCGVSIESHLNGLEAQISPSENESVNGKKWRKYIDSGTVSSRCAGGCNHGIGIDLSCHFFGSASEGINSVGYAFSYIVSDADRTINVYIGGDDGYMMWLNGESLLGASKSKHCGCFNENDSTVAVTLKKGLNRILLKVGSLDSHWGFIMTLSESEGLMASTVGEVLSTESATVPPFRVDNDGQLYVQNPSFLDFESQSSFMLQVVVTDSGNAKSQFSVLIELIDENEEPLYPPMFKFAVLENASPGTPVGFPLQPSDVDHNQKFAYLLTGGGNNFEIDAESGQISVKSGATLNFEGPEREFEMLVTCSDDGIPPKSATTILKIVLTDVNEQPTISSIEFVVPENSDRGVFVGSGLLGQVFDQDYDTSFMFDASLIRTEVRSEGRNDLYIKGKKPTGSILVGGVEQSRLLNGHNIVVLNETDGKIIESVNFDTETGGDADAEMVGYLRNLPSNVVVIGSVQDSGSRLSKLSAETLKSLGMSGIIPESGGSHSFVGKPGVYGRHSSSWQRLILNDIEVINSNGDSMKIQRCLSSLDNRISLAVCDKSDKYQLWNFANGYIRDYVSEKCLDIDNVNVGANATLRNCNETLSPFWDVKGGAITNYNVDGKETLCLALPQNQIRNEIAYFTDSSAWVEEFDFEVELIGNGQFINNKPIDNEYGSFDGEHKCVSGSSICGSRVILKISDGPGGKAAWALQFSPPENKGRTAQYQVHNSKRVGYKGVFIVSLWARCSNDYDGVKQLMRTRFFDSNGLEIGGLEGGFPSKCQWANWEHLKATFDSGSSVVESFILAIGYPLQNKQGSVEITDVSVRPATWVDLGGKLYQQSEVIALSGISNINYHIRDSTSPKKMLQWLVLGGEGLGSGSNGTPQTREKSSAFIVPGVDEGSCSIDSELSANLFRNANFEINGQGVPFWQTTGAATLLESESALHKSYLSVPPVKGFNLVVLEMDATLSQIIKTEAGKVYEVSFWARGTSNEGEEQIQVFDNEEVIYSTKITNQYEKYTMTLKASKSSALIKIKNSSPKSMNKIFLDTMYADVVGIDRLWFPKEGDKIGDRQWNAYVDNGKSKSSCTTKCNAGVGINLDCHFKNLAVVLHDTFVTTYIHSNNPRTVKLSIGPSGSFVGWINGNSINFGKKTWNKCWKCFEPNRYEVRIKLRSGVNQLTLKLAIMSSNEGNGFLAQMSCLESDKNCQNEIYTSTDSGLYTKGTALIYNDVIKKLSSNLKVVAGVALRGTGWLGLRIRYKNINNYYTFEFSAAYNLCRIKRVHKGVSAILESRSMTFIESARYDIAFTAVGGSLKVAVNNQVVFDLYDSSGVYDEDLGGGTVGIANAGVVSTWYEYRVDSIPFIQKLINSKFTQQSSTVMESILATDGVRSDRSCALTKREMNPWWRMDLGASRNVSHVEIMGTRKCCSNALEDIIIEIGNIDRPGLNVPCGPSVIINAGETRKIPCDGQRGRYVYIRSMKDVEVSLNLCEVSIYDVFDQSKEVTTEKNMVVESCSISQNSFRWDDVSARLFSGPNCTGDSIAISKFASYIEDPVGSIQLSPYRILYVRSKLRYGNAITSAVWPNK
jgi:hypothetical protein